MNAETAKENTNMTTLFATTLDDNGTAIDLEGESLEELASELKSHKCHEGQSVPVYDEAGFVRGWIHANGDWRAV